MTDKDETTVVADAEVVTDNEQTEALATVDETEMSPATQFDDNDPMLVANITLPTEDDITVKRIDDLLLLLDAYHDGVVAEDHKSK